MAQISYLLNRIHEVTAELENLKKGVGGVRAGKSVFVTGNQSFRIPECISHLTVTAIGGGGSGGGGVVSGNVFYAGGGGGAGEMVSDRGVVTNGKVAVAINVDIGLGGQGPSVNGNPTIITIVFNDGSKQIIRANGGQGGGSGVNNIGGQGGQSDLNPIFNGLNGQNGSGMLSSQGQPSGGRGGNSWTYYGGKGGNTYSTPDAHGNLSLNPNGEDGNYGSGGGGALPNAKSGKGGNGYCMIQW